MADVVIPVCICGNTIANNGGDCTTCCERQQVRHARHRSEQLDRAMHRSTTESAPARRRAWSVSASAALNDTFASDNGQSLSFQRTFYRIPSRPLSRPHRTDSGLSDSPSPTERTTISRQDSGPVTPTADDLRRPVTPDVASRERSYSPMAAPFARLSRKETHEVSPTTPERRSRLSNSWGSSLELEARMFDGPA